MDPAAGETERASARALGRWLWRLSPIVALVWLVLVPTFTSFGLLSRELSAERAPIGEDGISAQVRRYAAVREDLADVDRVGYVSDIDAARSFRGNWFFDAQVVGYAICPTLLVDSDAEPLVLGNFLDVDRAGEMARSRGLETVRDYGDGVFLFERVR